MEDHEREPTLEELICSKPGNYLYDCVSTGQAGLKKIEEYLAYDWDHPSSAAKKALAEQLNVANPFHPLKAIAMYSDPSNGKLLKLCLDNANISVKDFVCERTDGSLATCTLLGLSAPRGYVVETETFLQHGADPLESNGETLEAVIRATHIDILKLFKKYCPDQGAFFRQAMGAAARLSFKVLRYLIEEENQSLEGRFPDKTILQLSLQLGSTQVTGEEEISYILSRVQDINETDVDGNTALFYVLMRYTRDPVSGIAELILARNPSMDVVARNFNGYKGPATNVLFFAAHTALSDAVWKHTGAIWELLDKTTTLEHWKWKNERGETLLHFICRSGTNAFKRVFAMLKQKNLVREMLLQKDNDGNTPIFAAFAEMKESEKDYEDNYHYFEKQSSLRSIVRTLLDVAAKLGIDAKNLRSGDNKTLDSFLAWHNMLPKERRISPRIFSEPVEHTTLGDLQILSRDVLVNIFQFFTLSEAVALLTVNKKLLQIIACKQIWLKGSDDRVVSAQETIEPFAALCATERVKKLLARKEATTFFCEEIEVTCGEGNLSFESGFIQGLKLHGKPIIACFPDHGGSIVRCFVRSGTLTEEKKQYTAKLENLLNGGPDAINLSTLAEDMAPFMNALNNGTYSVALRQQRELSIYEYNSDTLIPQFLKDYPFNTMLFFTQPSDLLDRTRIDFYKNEILRGKRPIVLVLGCDYEYFLIDGHHKMKAYMETSLISQALFLELRVRCLNTWLSREAELEYISGIPDAISVHTSASSYHTYEN